MPLVAYAVSAKAMCQLQFWGGHENYREYQNTLWAVGNVIARDDSIGSHAFKVFLDWLGCEYGSGLSYSCPQRHFFMNNLEGFIVFMVVRPQEQPKNLRAINPLSQNKELLHEIPVEYGMNPETLAEFLAAQTFLHHAHERMAERDDETLVIASC